MSRTSIIVLLSVVILVCGIFYFFYLPIHKEIGSMQSKEGILRQTLQDAQEQIDMIPEIQKQADTAEKKIGVLAGNYFDVRDQEEYIVAIRDMGLISEVKINEINAKGEGVLELVFDQSEYEQSLMQEGDGEDGDETAPSAEPSVGTDGTDAANGGEGEEGGGKEPINYSDIGRYYSFEIQFECDYAQLTALLELIQDNKKEIVCSKLIVKRDDGSFTYMAPKNLFEYYTSDELDEYAKNIGAQMDVDVDSLVCTMDIGFYYLTDFSEYTFDENYVNVLRNGEIIKTDDLNPFIRVVQEDEMVPTQKQDQQDDDA